MQHENAKLTIIIDVSKLQFEATFETAGHKEDRGTGSEHLELLQLDRAGADGWEAWHRSEAMHPDTGNFRVVYLLKRQVA